MQVRIGKTLYETVDINEEEHYGCSGCCVAEKDLPHPSMSNICKKLNYSRKPHYCSNVVWKVVDESKNNL